MSCTISDAELLDQLTAGVAWLDDGLLLCYVNPGLCELTGFGTTRLLGSPLSALPPDGARLHASAQGVLGGQSAVRVRGVRLCATPGSERQLDVSFAPLREGVLLEARPAETMPPVSRLSESLRGFAHEVRNPLAAISGAAQLLQRRETDSPRRELAALIVSETQRLAALTERLLGARATFTTRAINVHALLEHLAQLLGAERADIEVVRDYDPSLPALHGDPDRLLQALLNLVRNAAESNARRIVLRSRAEAGVRDAHGKTLPAIRIEIEDDGDGVPDAIAQTLFEPMVSGRADGSGLGLAL
ncbi:MAG: histidine kinase dimerization/phospho-acceptor domain-containing protein, partial [Rhodanobacteraceae bacterium]